MKNALLFWFPLPLIAVINGFIREVIIKKYLNDLASNQVSVASLIMLFLVYGFLAKYYLKVESKKEALLYGAVWIAMTLVFEFGLGFITHKPLNIMLQEYNILEGRLWVLVIIFTGLFPLIIFKMKNYMGNLQ